MFAPGSTSLESSTRRLHQLNIDYGVPAAAAATLLPALSAQLDQHAAAVRDILEFGVEESARIPLTVLLAGYADGLLDHVAETAGILAGPPQSWDSADWLQLRLAALCQHLD